MTLCWLCDALLISAGRLGLGALLAAAPLTSGLIALAGGLFLLIYGSLNTKRAWQGGQSLMPDSHAIPASALKTAATLALTLLIPMSISTP